LKEVFVNRGGGPATNGMALNCRKIQRYRGKKEGMKEGEKDE